MQQVSLPWLVLALGGTPIQLGFVAVLQFGPSMVLAPFGGVFADRIDKRRALIATQVAASPPGFVLFVLTATGVVQIWMVMVMAFVLGLVNAIDMPLRQALAPDLVPRNLLANAIALNSMAFNAARVVGPALAGVIIAVGTTATGSATAGVAVNLGINTVTYAGVAHRPRCAWTRARSVSTNAGAASAGAREPARGVRLRGAHAARAVVPRPARRHRRVRLQLPDPAAALRYASARPRDRTATARCIASMGVGSLAGSLTLAFMRRRRAIPLMLVGGPRLLAAAGRHRRHQRTWSWRRR